MFESSLLRRMRQWEIKGRKYKTSAAFDRRFPLHKSIPRSSPMLPPPLLHKKRGRNLQCGSPPPPSPPSPLVAVGQGGPFQAPFEAAAAARDGRDRPAIFFHKYFPAPRVFRTFFPSPLVAKNVSLFPHPSYLEKKILCVPLRRTSFFFLPLTLTRLLSSA